MKENFLCHKNEKLKPHPERLNMEQVKCSLNSVEAHWDEINDKLEVLKIGRKDKFSPVVKDRLILAYEYLDGLLEKKIEPFSLGSYHHMLALNDIVHYGNDLELQKEYAKPIESNARQFYKQIEPVAKWYKKHKEKGDDPLKLASEVFVCILAHPQVFNEGNHRTGNLIANWINLYYGYPPFVLSSENAISFFAPSAEIKHFADKTTICGGMKIPKYNKSFRKFWERHTGGEGLTLRSI